MPQWQQMKDNKDAGYWTEDPIHLPFEWEANMAKAAEEHEKLVAEANREVAEAIKAFYRQKWYETAYARIRFALYWVTYWLRLKLAMAILALATKTEDERAALSKKLWYKLGL